MRPGEKQTPGGLCVPNCGLCPRGLLGFQQAPSVGDSTQGGASNHECRETGGPFPHVCLPSLLPLGWSGGKKGKKGWPRKLRAPPKEQGRVLAGQDAQGFGAEAGSLKDGDGGWGGRQARGAMVPGHLLDLK